MDATSVDKGKKRPYSSSSGGSSGGKPPPYKKSGAHAAKPAGSNTPKKKLPKKKKKKPKKEKKVDRTRDFSGDLEEYLEQWAARAESGSTWKFNKILQAWALEHCFNKKKVDADLFKQLMPYLMTVQGGALDRLTSRAAGILSTDKSDIVDDDVETPAAAEPVAEEAETEENVVTDEDDENAAKKVEIITKSMAHRAKKIQKGLNA